MYNNTNFVDEQTWKDYNLGVTHKQIFILRRRL